MKKIKKWLLTLSLLCMSFSFQIPVYANEIIQEKEGLDVQVRWLKEDISYVKEMEIFSEEDVLLYEGGLEEELDLETLEEEMKNKLILVSCFGYNTSSKNSEKWYYATQFLLWETLGYKFEVVGFEDYDTYKKQILEEIENSLTIPEVEEITLKGKETYLLTDELYFKEETLKDVLIQKNSITSLSNYASEGVISYFKDIDASGLKIKCKDGQILEANYKDTLSKEVNYKVQPYGTVNVRVEQEMVDFTYKQLSLYGEINTISYSLKNVENEGIKIYANEDIYDVKENLVYEKDCCIQSILTKMESVQSIPLVKGNYYAIWNEERIDFTIEENEEVPNVSISFMKNRNKGKVFLQKVFEQGSLEDTSLAYQDTLYAIYTKNPIYDVQGNLLLDKDALVYLSNIDENGLLIEGMDLASGSYYLKELITNSLYEKDENIYEFEINEAQINPVFINENGILESKLKRTSFTVYNTNDKVDASLFARFVLYDANMQEVKRFEVDENGKYVVEDLIEGTYYLEEVEIEEGYKLNREIQSINTNEGKNVHIKNSEAIINNAVSTKDTSHHEKWEITMLLSMLVFYRAFISKMKY